MMNIQPVSSDISRMQRYGPTPGAARVKAAPVSSEPVPFAKTEAIQSTLISLPEVKVPKAEEIKKMIQNNGYPFKSDLYKAVTRIVAADLN